MTPGAQLLFQPHLCVWATHRRLLLTCSGACPGRVGGGGAGAMVATPLACDSARALCFCSGPDFLLKHSQLWNSSLTSPDCLFAAHSNPLPETVLQTPRSSIQPLCTFTGTLPRLGRAGLWHGPVSGLSSESPEAPLLLADLPASEQ